MGRRELAAELSAILAGVDGPGSESRIAPTDEPRVVLAALKRPGREGGAHSTGDSSVREPEVQESILLARCGFIAFGEGGFVRSRLAGARSPDSSLTPGSASSPPHTSRWSSCTAAGCRSAYRYGGFLARPTYLLPSTRCASHNV